MVGDLMRHDSESQHGIKGGSLPMTQASAPPSTHSSAVVPSAPLGGALQLPSPHLLMWCLSR